MFGTFGWGKIPPQSPDHKAYIPVPFGFEDQNARDRWKQQNDAARQEQTSNMPGMNQQQQFDMPSLVQQIMDYMRKQNMFPGMSSPGMSNPPQNQFQTSSTPQMNSIFGQRS